MLASLAKPESSPSSLLSRGVRTLTLMRAVFVIVLSFILELLLFIVLLAQLGAARRTVTLADYEVKQHRHSLWF